MQILEFAMIGVVVSAVVEAIKYFAGTNSTASKVMAVGFSVAAAAAYYLLKDTSFWLGFLQILAFAAVVYDYIFKPLKSV